MALRSFSVGFGSFLAGAILTSGVAFGWQSHQSSGTEKAARGLEEATANLVTLNEKEATLNAAAAMLCRDCGKFSAKVKKYCASVATSQGSPRGDSQSNLMQETQAMQETQMSFNLQYLQLQNTMQNENRQFTMVSNILKTKHDTVKNSISNIH